MTYQGELKVTTPTDREIVMTREFNAPRRLVFDAFTKPALVRRWMFGWDGWTLDVCDIDLRVGGRFRFVWRGPDGTVMGMGGVYREVAPPERLSSNELFDEDLTGGETLVTLDLTEHGSTTLMTQTVLYSSRDARDGALETGAAEGLSMSLDRLDTILAEMS